MKKQRVKSVLRKMALVLSSAVMVSLFLLASHAKADDIEIFSNPNLSGIAPNVLFIFDFSDSMNKTPNGGTPSDGDPSKIDILRATLAQVLDREFSDLNVGVSWFTDRATGIRWPVSGINDDAHGIDSDIPTGEYKVGSVIQRMLETFTPDEETATVDALYEAALYFRGSEVWAGGREPPSWNAAEQKYKGGSWQAANPASYEPKNAWQEEEAEYGAKTRRCYDYTPSGGSNRCTGKQDVRNCVFQPAVEGVWNDCRWRKNCPCKTWDITGSECLKYHNTIPPCQCKGGWDVAPHADRYRCDYTRPGGSYTQGTWTGASYVSPITQACQPSFIVLLSDGAPSRRSADDEVENLVGIEQCEDLSPGVFNKASGTYTYGNCGPELVKYLNEEDQISTIKGSTVTTYTIGFGLDGPGGAESQSYLTKLADEGGGKFYTANDYAKLAEVLSQIIGEIVGNNEGFTGLATSVNSGTLSTNEKAYINLFKPAAKRHWIGNTKGYYLGANGLEDVHGNESTVEGPDGVRFKDTAQSFWSFNPDGNEVDQGGFLSKLNPVSRKIYTYTDPAVPDNINLTTSTNALTVGNTLITNTLLGLPAAATATDREAVIDWAHSAHMGDPLHSEPIEVNYGATQVLYSMTNAGFLHAIDVTHPTATGDLNGGTEIFSFVPQVLLGNLAELSRELSVGDHIYGLDGAFTVWREDQNKDGIISGGDHVYLYFGMRRGGNQYYALDVTDPNVPKLKWRIDGGSGDFARLGQTWSSLVLTTIKYQNSDRKVLIFGGGYDTTQDSKTDRSADSVGNAIYIVDASTGALLWSVSSDGTASATHLVLPDMLYSIPSDLRAVNTNPHADFNHADRLYFGDMGGQIWRIDISETLGSDASAATGYRLADLGGAGANNRRFYYPPSVALTKQYGTKYFSVAVGSGNRAHPLNTDVNDRFYMLKDINVDTGPPSSTPTVITESNLYDSTANIIVEGDTAEARENALSQLQASSGWYIELQNLGEKVLAEALTFDYKIMFTTYSPDFSNMNSDEGQCGPAGTNGRFYMVKMGDATPVHNYYIADGSSDDHLTVEDRVKTINGLGIPSKPVAIFLQDKAHISVNKRWVDTKQQSVQRTDWKPIH